MRSSNVGKGGMKGGKGGPYAEGKDWGRGVDTGFARWEDQLSSPGTQRFAPAYRPNQYVPHQPSPQVPNQPRGFWKPSAPAGAKNETDTADKTQWGTVEVASRNGTTSKIFLPLGGTYQSKDRPPGASSPSVSSVKLGSGSPDTVSTQPGTTEVFESDDEAKQQITQGTKKEEPNTVVRPRMRRFAGRDEGATRPVRQVEPDKRYFVLITLAVYFICRVGIMYLEKNVR